MNEAGAEARLGQPTVVGSVSLFEIDVAVVAVVVLKDQCQVGEGTERGRQRAGRPVMGVTLVGVEHPSEVPVADRECCRSNANE